MVRVSCGRAAGRAPRRCRPAAPTARRRPRRSRRRPARRSSGAAAAVQSCSSATSSARSSVMTSNATKCSRSWAGVTMPAWCAPWNGDRAGGAAAAARRRRRPRDQRARADAPPPATPAAPGTGERRAPAPGQPSILRGARRCSAVARVASRLRTGRHLRDDRGDLADRLGQGVDRVGEFLELGLVSSVCSFQPSPARCLPSAASTRGELGRRAACTRSGSRSSQDRAQRRDGGLGALDVGREVPQVGVRVAVLLAGDLAGGDLVEQLLGAVGQLQRGELLGVGLGDDLLDVGQQLVGDRAVSC